MRQVLPRLEFMLLELQNKKNGFGLFEIILASAIMVTVLFSLVAVFLLSKNTAELSLHKLKASFLAEEGLEVVRFLRDSSWHDNISLLSQNQDYYLIFATSTSSWSINSSPPPSIDGFFERSFQVARVSRDASYNIESVYNASNDDPDTRKITMKVAWNFKGQNQSLIFETYLTDLFDN